MPIIVFGISLYLYEKKNGTSLFVQKRFLRTNYIESNNEEDNDMKKNYKIKIL